MDYNGYRSRTGYIKMTSNSTYKKKCLDKFLDKHLKLFLAIHGLLIAMLLALAIPSHAQPATEDEPSNTESGNTSTSQNEIDADELIERAERPKPNFDVIVDGDVSEWPAEENMYLYDDPHFIYAKFDLNQRRTLHRGGGPVVLALDIDNDPDTGSKLNITRGVDLEIEFDPVHEVFDQLRPSIKARYYSTDGVITEVTPYDLQLYALPLHSSRQFELRFSRFPAFDPVGLTQVGLLSKGRMRGILLERTAQGLLDQRTDLGELRLDPRADTPPAVGDFVIPDRPEGSLRFVSWNVLWSEPIRTPAPYARVLKALKPDVVMIQEWRRRAIDPGTLVKWFEDYVDDTATWTAVVSHGQGVVTVVRTEPSAVSTRWSRLFADTRNKESTLPIRQVAAAIDFPIAPVNVFNLHLTEGGHFQSPEDDTRLLEAGVINMLIQKLDERHPAAITVAGGSLFVEGNPNVLERLLRDTDPDGGTLVAAPTTVLGTDIPYTFGRPREGSSLRRIDYLFYNQRNARLQNAFVLDTTRYSPEALAQYGLDPEDTQTSQHLPLVVDLKPILAKPIR